MSPHKKKKIGVLDRVLMKGLICWIAREEKRTKTSSVNKPTTTRDFRLGADACWSLELANDNKRPVACVPGNE